MKNRISLSQYISQMFSEPFTIHRNNYQFVRRIKYVNYGMAKMFPDLTDDELIELKQIVENLFSTEDVVLDNIEKEKELWVKTGEYLGVIAAEIHKPWFRFVGFMPINLKMVEQITAETPEEGIFFPTGIFDLEDKKIV